jgi:amidase
VTARAVVEEHLARIAALDKDLGAFVLVRSSAALLEADELDLRPDKADLPLAGVPVAIKDNIPVAGEPMRSGSAATSDAPQPFDHPVVARLRAAGAIIVGITNLPELGIYAFTDSVYGISRNPWDPSRTAGGSSGGAAAAVASGMVPIAHGNDGAGSIRIPAANCGLFGIKPGTGVIPSEIGADSWGGMSENGPLATTVADAALAFQVMAGLPPTPVERPDVLRIALSVRSPVSGVTVHKEFVNAVRAAGRLLTESGHKVEHADPKYPLWAANALTTRWLSYPAVDAAPFLSGTDLETRTRRHVRAGRVAAKLRPAKATDRERFQHVVAPFFKSHDVLLMPSLAQFAPEARRWGSGSWMSSVVASMRYAPMAAAWNLAGYPAASVPVGVAENGLPLAVQLVTGPGNEALLFGLAEQLENWPRLAPGF